MADEQWLKAFAKYDSEYSHHPNDFLKGGAWELAGMFRDFVRNEPERFARLSLRLPCERNPAYLERAIDALKETNAPLDLKFELCRKGFAEHPNNCGTAIVDLLGTIKEPLPNDLIAMLRWFATEHPDPEQELWDKEALAGKEYYGGDILTHGINTVRGRAAEAIRDLILSDSNYIARFSGVLSKLTTDRSLAVRACVASTLLAVARYDWRLAIRLFKKLVQPASSAMRKLENLRQNIPSAIGVRGILRVIDGILSNYLVNDDRLLGTQYVDRFIYYALRDHFSHMRPIVERMLRSRHRRAREAGARLASLAAIYHPDQSLITEALKGDAAQRLGVAQVASSNIADAACRQWCETQLLKLFNDTDADVRRESAVCFHKLKGASFEDYRDLVSAFAESEAYESNSSSILFALEESSEKLPGITATACERFVSRFASEARDIRTSRAGDVHTVAKLVFRTYHQHETDQWGSKCLDLIDQMCLEGLQEVSTGLAEFER